MKPLPLILILFTLAACSAEECLDNQTSLPLAGFYASTPKAQAISISNLTVGGDGAPGDSLLMDHQSATELYLPFKIDADQTQYTFTYRNPDTGDEFKDNITFRYKSSPYFTGASCGVVYRYEITGIDHTGVLIDSIRCPKGIIDNKPGQNIKIYFKYNETEQ